MHLPVKRRPIALAACAIALSLAMVTRAVAQAAPTDSTPRIIFGAFVDSYYAWDFGRPLSLDHSFAGGTTFLTQPARHNEFSIRQMTFLPSDGT